MGIYGLKGIVVHSPRPEQIEYCPDHFVICRDGRCLGVFEALPDQYQDIPVQDYSGCFILPGMTDLHLHASQYGFRAIGMLMDPKPEKSWFDRYSLPEEAKFADLQYAREAYSCFVKDLLENSPTTRAVIYGTIHRPATELLMELLDKTGLYAYVGKLNMDRNSPPELIETTEETLEETRRWLEETTDRYDRVKPIITPRYLPSCTNECLEGIGRLSREFKAPVQSHMSADPHEIAWVKKLKPEAGCYGEAYDEYGLLGSEMPAVMAHVVYPTEREYEMLAGRKAWVAHCPRSNTNAANGVAPVREMLDRGLRVGLASDVGSNFSLNLLREIANAVQVSKLRWVYTERREDEEAEKNYLTLSESFYMATKGGGSFFGKVGSFEEGYQFDAVVIDDSDLKDVAERPLDDRLQRILWLSEGRHIRAKYVGGDKVL